MKNREQITEKAFGRGMHTKSYHLDNGAYSVMALTVEVEQFVAELQSLIAVSYWADKCLTEV